MFFGPPHSSALKARGFAFRAGLAAWPGSSIPRALLSFRVTPSLKALLSSTGISTCCPSPTRLPPRLRPRLTLSGRALLRKPWAFDGEDSHFTFATHANILSSHPSTKPSSPASARWDRSPTKRLRFRRFGIRFEPRLFSARPHSTSELLRTLSMRGCF